VENGISRLLEHFREAFAGSPTAAYREWFRAQEELRDRGEEDTARLLADDLWDALPGFSFDSSAAEARFLHNVGVFYGSAGPAADLSRARACFGASLAHFAAHSEDGWRARALHNLGTAISNLGQTGLELQEAVGHFLETLAWRTPEREIARGVTLHNMGIALRRLADLDPGRAGEHLARSASALREAVGIRERNGLSEGLGASRRELAETLTRLPDAPPPGPE
jgi:hypothetical protein